MEHTLEEGPQGDAVLVNSGGVNEMSSSTPSATNNNEPKTDFKVIFNENGSESFFMIADLKNIADIDAEIIKHHPELCSKRLLRHYFNEHRDKLPINDAIDFAIFMKTHVDENIYVSCVHENVVLKKEPEDRQAFQLKSIGDVIFWAAFIFAVVNFITTVVEIGGFFHQDSEPETRLNQWSEYKKIIQEFCHSHSTQKDCENVILDFLSFMSIDSLAQSREK